MVIGYNCIHAQSFINGELQKRREALYLKWCYQQIIKDDFLLFTGGKQGI